MVKLMVAMMRALSPVGDWEWVYAVEVGSGMFHRGRPLLFHGNKTEGRRTGEVCCNGATAGGA